MSNEELAAAIQAGERERMGELWQQVEGLVKWKANRVINALDGMRGVEFDDLYNSGYLALVMAVEGYRPESGAFSTWFLFHLKTAFAEATGFRSEKQKRDPLHYAGSLDAPLDDSPGSDTVGDLVSDPMGEIGFEAVEDVLYRKQLHEALERVIGELPEDRAEILRLRFWQDKTLAEVGEVRGITPERVRQNEKKAIRELRKPKHIGRLMEFVDFDYYHGSGAGSFKYSGMSIQEHYLVARERAEARQKEQDQKHRADREWAATMEKISSKVEEGISQMTPEEKAQLLEQYGYA